MRKFIILCLMLLIFGARPQPTTHAAADRFESTRPNEMWDVIAGGRASRVCGVGGDTRSLYFNGIDNRQLITVPLDVTDGGTIRFDIKFGAEAQPYGCDQGERGDDVLLQYSVDDGRTWNTIGVYRPRLIKSFTRQNVEIPPAARTEATRFRWQQVSWGARGRVQALRWDHWAIDNISIPTRTLNAQPETESFVKITQRGFPLPFYVGDFDRFYRDGEDEPLAAVRIDSLPEEGTLEFEGAPVTVGQEIPRDALGSLRYLAGPDFVGDVRIGYSVSDGVDYSAPAEITIDILTG